ncbi:sensor histidine kinase [Kitasatospora sp. NPDC058162]|uniref:sensor histidine kinase n=1 Tax=Kitasatospora sp. NPDC058162 TaxID=3346362 RepID=UPI0036D94826
MDETAGFDAPPPRLALAIVVVVQLGFVVVGFLNLATCHPTRGQFLAAGLIFLGVSALQFVHCAPGLREVRERFGRWTLSAQAVLTYLPLVFFGFSWGGMPGFLGSSVLLLLRGAVAGAAFGAVVASAGISGLLLGVGVAESVYLTVAAALTGLIVFGLTSLAQLVIEVRRAQQELARLAVTRERLRFARDLHDLLGYSLSAITLKSELTSRLVTANPQRALEELGGVLEISRQALADVRAVARGYREMSLAGEAVSARSVLAAAGIEARFDVDGLRPDGPADTVLATVLREGVTNLLRHSTAERCVVEGRVAGGRLRLTLSNDGVPGDGAGPGDGDGRGGGLDNLEVRLAELGGRLSAGSDDRGWFHLVAEVPC